MNGFNNETLDFSLLHLKDLGNLLVTYDLDVAALTTEDSWNCLDFDSSLEILRLYSSSLQDFLTKFFERIKISKEKSFKVGVELVLGKSLMVEELCGGF